MRVVTTIRRAVAGDDGPAFRCAFCDERFGREPPNCPACGSSTLVEVGT